MSFKEQVQIKTDRYQSGTAIPICFLQHKKGPNCQDEECLKNRKQVQRKPSNYAESSKVPSIVYDVLRSPGQPLDPDTRVFMESRFGHDFSQVRIHTDAKAAESTHTVNALAYTVGPDIVFQQGLYRPELSEGKKLIAHELTHFLQQGKENVTHRASADSLSLQEGQRGDVFEKEADTVSQKVLNIYEPMDSRAGQQIETMQVGRENGLPLQREEGRPTRRRRRQSTLTRPLVQINIDTSPAQIDRSKTIDEITHEFYRIPIDLLPPNSPIPMGPILTIGPYGCGLRRYGLTIDDFSLTYTLDNNDIQSRSRPFNLGSTGSNLETVECWANHVLINARLRQTILIPNDLATHPCMRGENPGEASREILDHERLHEGDNNQAVEEILGRLRTRLGFTLGIGSLMAMVRITDDPQGFIEECTERIRNSLDQLRDEYDLEYHRLSAQYAGIRDPHDQELHNLKLRLLEEARTRQSNP